MKVSYNIGLLVFMLLVAGCSEPPRYLLLNNSGHDIVVKLGLKDYPIRNGQYLELYYDPATTIDWAGTAHVYRWQYPLPSSDYMEFGRPSGRFAVSLEADGEIYARKISNGRPADSIPHQPAGYPIGSGQ